MNNIICTLDMMIVCPYFHSMTTKNRLGWTIVLIASKYYHAGVVAITQQSEIKYKHSVDNLLACIQQLKTRMQSITKLIKRLFI